MEKQTTYKESLYKTFDIKEGEELSTFNQVLDKCIVLGAEYRSFNMDKDWVKYPKEDKVFEIVGGETLAKMTKRFVEYAIEYDVIYNAPIRYFLNALLSELEKNPLMRDHLKKEHMIRKQYIIPSIFKIKDLPSVYLERLEKLGANYILPHKDVKKRIAIGLSCSELLTIIGDGNIQHFEYLNNKLDFNILEDVHFQKLLMKMVGESDLDFNGIEYLLNDKNTECLKSVVRDIDKESVKKYTDKILDRVFRKIKKVNYVAEKSENAYKKLDIYRKLITNIFSVMDYFDEKLKTEYLGEMLLGMSKSDCYKENILLLVDLDIIKDKKCLNDYIFKGLNETSVVKAIASTSQSDFFKIKNVPVDAFLTLSLGNYGLNFLEYMHDLKIFSDVFNIEDNDNFASNFTNNSRLLAMNNQIVFIRYSTMIGSFDWQLMDKKSDSLVVNNLKLYDKTDANNITVYHQLFKEGLALSHKKVFNDLLRENPSIFSLKLDDGKTLGDYAVLGAQFYAKNNNLDVDDCVSQVEKKLILKLSDKIATPKKPLKNFKM